MFKVENLVANVGRKQILSGLTMEIADHSVCAIMGLNGCGKSTFLNCIFSHPAYTIKSGSITYNGANLLQTAPEDISGKGLFISYQTPPDFIEMTGMECLLLLEQIHGGKQISKEDFEEKYGGNMKKLSITPEMLERPLNVGFSGGERKRMELLQMLIIKPKMILLDEIDTGLDVDNLILIGETLKEYVSKTKATVIIVTHYLRFLEYLKPDKVFVMSGGQVIKEGGYELADAIDKKGYSSIANQ